MQNYWNLYLACFNGLLVIGIFEKGAPAGHIFACQEAGGGGGGAVGFFVGGAGGRGL